MHDTERLIQRFLDQELSAEERVAFLAQLGRDPDLRRRAADLDHMLLEVRSLPKPRVPTDFSARVLARVTPATVSWWERVGQAVRAPLGVQVHLAGAAAAACLAAVVGGLLTQALLRQTVPAPDPTVVAVASSPRPGSPTANVFVRLVLVQPGARSVQVAGDFNGWNPARTPLEPASGGAWTVTIPLQPGRYEYMYVVDGRQWVADPLATEQRDDGFGAQNAVLEIRPPADTVL